MANSTLIDLIKTHALSFGDFTLSSGAKSSYFIDMSKVTNDSLGLLFITKEILERIIFIKYGKEPDWNWVKPDAIGGPVLGAAPLIGGTLIKVAMSLIYDKELRGFLVRKEIHNNEFIEGSLKENDKVVVLEDVTTTGTQTLRAIKIIENHGADEGVPLLRRPKVIKVISVVDRLAGASELLKDYNFESLLTIKDLGING
jgi:orotate phosphoribosyltransferase